MRTLTFRLTRPPRSRGLAEPWSGWRALLSAYTVDVALGRLPGPHRAREARAYARCALVCGELLERPSGDIDALADALGVPAAQLRLAVLEHAATAAGWWSP